MYKNHLKVLEEVINEKKKRVELNRYAKNVPLARYYDMEKIEFLEPILDILKDLQERLERLEK